VDLLHQYRGVPPYFYLPKKGYPQRSRNLKPETAYIHIQTHSSLFSAIVTYPTSAFSLSPFLYLCFYLPPYLPSLSFFSIFLLHLSSLSSCSIFLLLLLLFFFFFLTFYHTHLFIPLLFPLFFVHNLNLLLSTTSLAFHTTTPTAKTRSIQDEPKP